MKSIDLLSVGIGLTDLGEKDYLRVIKILYSYINKIKQEGMQKYIYEEMSHKRKIDFEYMEK